jgi:hypothetical protein
MSTPGLNPLSFNAYIQQVGVMAVALTAETGGVWGFVDAPLQEIVPMILNYSEGRIQRDLDLLTAKTSNLYTLTAGLDVLQLPINDFIIVEAVQLVQVNGSGAVVNNTPLVQVSNEFMQNVCGGLSASGTPKYWAMIGDAFGDGANTYNQIRVGPPPNYPYSIGVRGIIRTPSLYQNASAGIADTGYTYISTNYPDMLVIASMIYVSAFQRQFSSTSDDPTMPMNYEKQYQALRLGAIAEENRKKGQASAWSGYSTPVSATPTR